MNWGQLLGASGNETLDQASLCCFCAFPGQPFLAVAQKLLCGPGVEAGHTNLSPPHLGGDSETEQSLGIGRMPIARIALVASMSAANQSV